jgi:hypothetical protein
MDEAFNASQVICHGLAAANVRIYLGSWKKKLPLTRKKYAVLHGTVCQTACTACLAGFPHAIIHCFLPAARFVCASKGMTRKKILIPTLAQADTNPMKSTRSAPVTSPALLADSSIRVRHSIIHGNGVFATRKIPAGARIIEYGGKRITENQAEKRFGLDPENPHHTFFFSLESGKLIDGGDQGNDARWINHSCTPNCEAQEEKGRVYIHALRDIPRGEELSYDYGLVIEEKMTKALKQAYACRCGTAECRGTMLAPAKKSTKKKV